MIDRDKVFDAFRNCITEPKCRDCPWEQCEQFNQKKVEIPVTLALDVIELLKEQETMKECLKRKCVICPHCENCDVDENGLLKEQEAVSAHWDDDTGHWIEGDRNGIDPHTRITGEMIDTFRCSWCGFYQYWKTPFCPNCGAKMEGR